MSETLAGRLERNETLIMDMGFGTELPSHEIEAVLPLWSGIAPLSETGQTASRQIHIRSIEIGEADILIAGTFRTQPYVFRKAGLSTSVAREATLTACRLTREARDQAASKPIIIAASNAPLEDCYSPQDTPKRKLLTHHRTHAENLAEAQALGDIDFYLPETMITLRETEAALRAGQLAGLSETAVSFCCMPDGLRLLGGESLKDAVRVAEKYEVSFVGVNCVKVSVATLALEHLATITTLPIAVYAQGGEDTSHEHVDAITGSYQDYYVQQAERWHDMGAQIIGGCCGATPYYGRDIYNKLATIRTAQ